MPVVTYIEDAGVRHAVDVRQGESVMEGALYNDVPGIVGECGGGLACATCHCYVDDAWIDRVGRAEGTEAEMLESAAAQTRPNSRLSCQIAIDDSLDGLVVRLPPTQF
jgi:2Fe-2S ferredoxin